MVDLPCGCSFDERTSPKLVQITCPCKTVYEKTAHVENDRIAFWTWDKNSYLTKQNDTEYNEQVEQRLLDDKE